MTKIDEIMTQAGEMHNQIREHLKANSPTYPQYYMEGAGDENRSLIYISTLVPFEYEGRTYLRHHIEMWLMTDNMDIIPAIMRLRQSCKITMEHGIPIDMEGAFGTRVKDDDITEKEETHG